ncbi:unnamed protein product, partial [Lymnaea stagnalis]
MYNRNKYLSVSMYFSTLLTIWMYILSLSPLQRCFGNPSLCNNQQTIVFLEAKLGTDARASICFVGNGTRIKKFDLAYNSRWIRHDGSDDKIKFVIIRNPSFPIHYTLNLTVRNIAVYDYGIVDITLPIADRQALHFKMGIFSDGRGNVTFIHN